MNKGYLWTLFAVLILATSSGILVKFITVPAFTLYAIGAFWGLLFLLLVLAVKGNLKDLFSYPRKTLILMIILGIGVSINNGLFFTALKSGLVSNAVLAHGLAPLFVVLVFSPIMLKEKITFKNFLLSILGLIGLYILVLPNLGTKIDTAILYGGLAAVFWAFHTVLEKKVTQTNADPLSAIVYKNFIPLVVFAPFAFKSLKEGISIQNQISLALFGIIVLGIAFVFLFKGISKISATSSSILGYGEPIGAIILAAIFFGEPITIYTIVGGSLIILSGIGVIKEKQ